MSLLFYGGSIAAHPKEKAGSHVSFPALVQAEHRIHWRIVQQPTAFLCLLADFLTLTLTHV